MRRLVNPCPQLDFLGVFMAKLETPFYNITGQINPPNINKNFFYKESHFQMVGGQKHFHERS